MSTKVENINELIQELHSLKLSLKRDELKDPSQINKLKKRIARLRTTENQSKGDARDSK
tara:strand:+ start:519 stop:695 length:177 start_codon:yes stop_codon:yes gene_type:complete